MSDVTLMLEYLRNEKINIELTEGESFFYNPQKKSIGIPYSVDLNSNNSLHALAHEAGHYLQRKKRPNYTMIFDSIRGSANKGHFTTSFLVLCEEINAWYKGYKLCKRLNLNTHNYFNNIMKPIFSYTKPLMQNIVKTLKQIVSLYFISFAITRVIKISSSRDIPNNLPLYIRDTLLTLWDAISDIELDAAFTSLIFINLLIIYFILRVFRLLFSLIANKVTK